MSALFARYGRYTPINRNPKSSDTTLAIVQGAGLVQVKGAADRIVRRSPNSYELANNFEIRVAIPRDYDSAPLAAWAEAIEPASTDLYPLERISKLRLHVHRHGAKSKFSAIHFRDRSDAEVCAELFPLVAEALRKIDSYAEKQKAWARVADVDSRIADAREDEAAHEGLGQLRGSEKQVAWAGDIRRQYLQRGACDPAILATRDAKWWIENRSEI